MNVLMLGCGRVMSRDDAEAVARHLDYARAAGGRVCLLGRGGPSFAVGPLRVLGLDVPARPLLPLLLERAAKHLWPEYAFDLIYARDPFLSALVGTRLARWSGAALLLGSHSNFLDDPHFLAESPWRNRVLNRLARRLLPRGDGWRVLNAQERGAYLRLGLPPERVRIANVPLDLTPFAAATPEERARVRASLGLDTTDKVLVWAGRLVPEKRLPVLIAAVERLAARHSGLRLLLIGAPGAEPDIPASLSGRVLRISRHVRPAELAGYFVAADIFVHAALREGFGRTLAEAGAAGLPVAASPSAGAELIVRPGRNGFIAADGSAEALAHILENLLSRPDLGRTLGDEGRALALSAFSRAAMTGAVVDLWRQTVAWRQEAA